MTGKVYFNESQRMDQLWLKLVMALAAVTAFTIKGNQSLQLHFKNGKKLLLGTQQPAELETAIRKAKGEESEESWQRKRHLL